MNKAFRAMGVVAISVFTVGVASAAPGWAWSWRVLGADIDLCTQAAARGMRSMTGNEPEINRFDANNVQLHAYRGDEVVFAYCTAAEARPVCGKPRASLKLQVMSSSDSVVAATARDAVDAAIGPVQIIDCGTELDPI